MSVQGGVFDRGGILVRVPSKCVGSSRVSVGVQARFLLLGVPVELKFGTGVPKIV